MLPPLLLAVADARDPATRSKALRTLFGKTLRTRPFGEGSTAAWEQLAALCGRVASAEVAIDPERGGGERTALDLGDGWWQCPGCADAFEGDVAACPACGAGLGTSAPTLMVRFSDGGTLWLGAPEEGTRDPTTFGALPGVFGWVRAAHGAREFIWLDAAARARTRAKLSSAVLAAVGDRPPIARVDGSTYLFARPEHAKYVQLDVSTNAQPSTQSPPSVLDVLADGIARVLGGPPDALVSQAAATDATAQLLALGRATVWSVVEWTERDGYLESDELAALVATPGVPPTALAHAARVIMASASFDPGSNYLPAELAGDRSRRIGSPLPVFEPLLVALRQGDEAHYLAIAAELLGLALVTGNVLDHSPDGYHGNIGEELADALARAPVASLPPDTLATLLASFARACEACGTSQFGIDLVPLGLALLKAPRPADRDTALAALYRFFALDQDPDDDDDEPKIRGYIEESIISREELCAYTDQLAALVGETERGARLVAALRA